MSVLDRSLGNKFIDFVATMLVTIACIAVHASPILMPTIVSTSAGTFLVIRGFVVCLAAISIVVTYKPQTARAEEVSIQLQSAKLRSAPRQFAPTTADLRFGDALSVKSQASGWFEVTLPDGRSGFIHQSAVTGKKIVLSERQVSLADVAVDESQVYLAGKGFNGAVEQAFETSEEQVDYQALGTMKSTLGVSEPAALAFLEEGNLSDS